MSSMKINLLRLILAEMFLGEDEPAKEERQEFSIGDVLVLNTLAAANYLINVKTKNQLSKNSEPLPKSFIETLNNKGFVVAGLDVDHVYDCGHCNNPHKHDIVVYSLEFNTSFYASSEDFKLKK